MSPKNVSPDDVLSNLIVRLYKICTHSLAESSVVEKYRKPYRTGPDGVIHAMGTSLSQHGSKFSGIKFSDSSLDREKFESLAARCRPLTLQDGSESLYKIMNALRQSVPNMHRQYSAAEQNTFQKEIDVLQVLWLFYSDKSRDFEKSAKKLERLGRKDLATMVERQSIFLVRNARMTLNDQTYGQKINLFDVGYRWVYADLVHNDLTAKTETFPHTEEDRYECAIPFIFSIVYMCTKYLAQIKSMETGIIEMFNLSDEAKKALSRHAPVSK